MAEEHHNKYETAVVEDLQVPVETTDRGLFNFHRKKEEEKHQEEAIVTDFDEKVTVSGCEPKEDQDQEYEKEKLEKEEKKHGLLEKLHRSNSSSSSKKKKDKIKDKIIVQKKEEKDEDTNVPVEKYEEEEVVHAAEPVQPEGKKGFLDKIKEKLPGLQKKTKKKKKDKIKDKIAVQKKEEKDEDTNVPVEKYEEEEVVHAAEPVQPEGKKGFIDKIKEKLPGLQKKTKVVPTPPPPPPYAEYAAAKPVPDHEGEAKKKKGFLEKIKEKLPGLMVLVCLEVLENVLC